ncbi:lipocalin-like domain-containing protein [Spirosoma radiotolerans]|uniref:Lipocalin-like domain-containing protein n=1 Tax=Spirosoma radiotolerans TaxID=1379870 RepID=A0A0E3V9W1_9BACT|nr:lipocalin family protein [Spirosoma radiotolerans]AKD57516.1 hypothetical protein SD10_24085 [Spirosoma radiotolerans]
MNCKSLPILIAVLAVLCGCQSKETSNPIVGTWELVSATSTEKDTSFSTFDPTHKMIKIINADHFSFLNHKLRPGNDSSSNEFSGGGGKYTLTDSVYTEHLDYFTNKQWEGNTFKFVVKVANDTLTQKGVEKLDKLGIDRVIVEKYKRVTE